MIRPIRLITIGRLIPLKNTLQVVRALKRLRDDGFECELNIVGDGECRDEIEKFIFDHNLGSYVTLHGSIANASVVDLLKTADICVHASRKESFGVAMAEAMAAAGIPVVAAASGGAQDIVDEGVIGFLYPVDDDNGLVSTLTSLANDTTAWQAMGAAAHDKAKSTFSWQPRMDVLVDIWSSAMEADAGIQHA